MIGIFNSNLILDNLEDYLISKRLFCKQFMTIDDENQIFLTHITLSG